MISQKKHNNLLESDLNMKYVFEDGYHEADYIKIMFKYI